MTYKNLLKSLTTIFMFIIFLPAQSFAFDFFSTSCSGSAANSSVCTVNKSASGNPVVHLIQIAADVLALLAGMLAVVMIIISAFTLVTSAGNAEAVTNSRKRIVNSLIGLVIIALAWTIIRLVTGRIIQ